jgi:hypothetical protein
MQDGEVSFGLKALSSTSVLFVAYARQLHACCLCLEETLCFAA